MAVNQTAPGRSGTGILPGLISWFGGPNDPTSGPTTASGAPVTQPGIAVYNRATLGGWWVVKAPNGTIGLVQQTDIGPAPSTGRTFDFTSSLLQYFGYNEHNFPTGSTAQGVYVGKGATLQDVMGKQGTAISNALGHLGATPKQTAAFITQADTGAGGMHGATFTVDTNGNPASPASTTPSGDAVSAGINVPNPVSGIVSEIGGIWGALTNPHNWLRALEILGAVIAIYFGLKSLTGAPGVTEVPEKVRP